MAVIVAWSGGKDACLALYRSVQAGHKPLVLLTMMEADGLTSRAHALPLAVLQQQADALGLPLIAQAAPKESYREAYVAALLAAKALGATAVVFGDIDLQAHRDWQELVGAEVGLTMQFPLWENAHPALLGEFLAAGFTTTIIAVKQGVLDERWLGRELNAPAMQALAALGVDVCGEGGEFHTFVTGGALFARPLQIVPRGSFAGQYDYTFLDFTVEA